MRVLNVNMSIGGATGGGAGERTAKIATHLARLGISSSILTSDFGLDRRLIRSLAGVELEILPCVFPRFLTPRFRFSHLEEMVRNADIVHLMNHWTLINILMHAICRRLEKPYVFCPAGSLPVYGRSRALKRIYNLAAGKRIVLNASRNIAIPEEERSHFVSYGADPESVVALPNGVAPKDFQYRDDAAFRKRHSLKKNPFLLFMGRLNPIKGPDILLNAFAGIRKEAPDYHLVCAGPDEGMLSGLKQKALRSGLEDAVHFIGYIEGEEKSQAYHAADLLVIPSRQEAMSIVALEAGACGTPVLLTDVCGFDQVAQIGGGMVSKPTVPGVRDSLRALLKEPGMLREMGKKLKAYVLRRHTWESVAQRHIDLFEDILKERQKR